MDFSFQLYSVKLVTCLPVSILCMFLYLVQFNYISFALYLINNFVVDLASRLSLHCSVFILCAS